MTNRTPRRRPLSCALLLGAVALTTACSTDQAVIGAAAATIAGGYAPGNELEQVYYLGVFDPREQVPPMFYRVVVRGQASAISKMKFGSGWVPASVIDGINSNFGSSFDASTKSRSGTSSGDPLTGEHGLFDPGRGLVMFGPEGFRKAPRDHRLAIVMGSSPESFFQAIDQSLGLVAEVREERRFESARQELLEAMVGIQSQTERLRDLTDRGKSELAKPPAAESNADTPAKKETP